MNALDAAADIFPDAVGEWNEWANGDAPEPPDWTRWAAAVVCKWLDALDPADVIQALYELDCGEHLHVQQRAAYRRDVAAAVLAAIRPQGDER